MTETTTKPRIMRRIAKTFIVSLGGGAAAIALAQSAPPEFNSATQLDLPSEFTIFGERDPNIRKPTVIVNGEIVTRTDVDQRLALMIAANEDAVISEDERQRLRMQVLRNLIDETLQIQEATANEIVVDPSEVQSTFQNVSSNFSSSPSEFAAFLRTVGSSERSIKRQIEGELAWNRLLRRYVNPRVEVSEAEVQAIIGALEASRGEAEYRVAEIYLSARPDNQAEVLANAHQIIAQLQQGGSFPAYARQYSESPTANVGGDLGWVRPEMLPAELAQAVTQIPVGSISNPIALPGGFSIIAIADQRRILVSDPRDAVLSLKQITVTFPAGTSREQAEPIVARLAEATQQSGGCGVADQVAAAVGGDVVQNDEVRLRDLPASLQEGMAGMQIGEATPPFGSLESGVRVLVLCGRDDPPSAAEPDAEVIETNIRNDRVNRQARRYLRDLRRDAVIEYR